MSRATYLWDRDLQDWVPIAEFRGARHRRGQGLQVVKDIEPYQSTITREVIGGRRQHRDHLRAHRCIEVGNEFLALKQEFGPRPGEIAAEIKRAMGE